ncbi:MAG: hypothetical protein ABRQ38_24735 [Candidatus Eremiobacterota bacterium]
MKKILLTLILIITCFFISCKNNSLPEVTVDRAKFEGKIMSVDKVVYLEAEPFLKKLHLTPSVEGGKIRSGYDEIDKKIEKYYLTKDGTIYIAALDVSKALGATGTFMAEYNTLSINTANMPPLPVKKGVSTGDGANPLNPGHYINKAVDAKKQVDQFQNQ